MLIACCGGFINMRFIFPNTYIIIAAFHATANTLAMDKTLSSHGKTAEYKFN